MVSLVGSNSLEVHKFDPEKSQIELDKWIENCKSLYDEAQIAENKKVMKKAEKALNEVNKLKKKIRPINIELSSVEKTRVKDLNALICNDGIKLLIKVRQTGDKILKRGKEEFESKDDESIKRAARRREKETQRLLQQGTAKPSAKSSFKKEMPIEPMPEPLAIQEPELSEAEASGEESSVL
jgi:hypothetical protein